MILKFVLKQIDKFCILSIVRLDNIMLYLLCGPIASGKSTYCKQAALDGKIILNDDSIVNAVHGGNYQLYQSELKFLYKGIENSIVTLALALNKDVVVDRPNHSIKMRRRYIGLAHSLDHQVTLVMFKREKPEIHGMRRFQSDNRGHSLEYWTKVAERHNSIYEPPNQDLEQFDYILDWNFNENRD